MDRRISFSPPDIREEDIREVVETLKSGWITTGKQAALLADKIVSYTGCGGCIALNSATSALELALRWLGIGAGDEVILPAYTFTATASVVLRLGAVPVMADISPDSYLIDPENVLRLLTSRTKAVIGVDLGGVCAGYSELRAILEDARSMFRPDNGNQERIGRVALVADAAHSLGAESRGIKSGNMADLTAFSFHAVKNLTTAEGGALCWNESLSDSGIGRWTKLMSCHGMSRDAYLREGKMSVEYDIEAIGLKCNLPDTLASLAINQMDRYDDILIRRHHLLSIYQETLEGSRISIQPQADDMQKGSAHLAMVQLPGDRDFRDRVLSEMFSRGISCNIHYKPLPLHTAYRNIGYSADDVPLSIERYFHELSLPLYSSLSDDDAEYIAGELKDVVDRMLV